jgi:hypothetical protein
MMAINFNPCAPGNMNVYIPEQGNTATVFVKNGGRRWCQVDRQTAIKWLMDDRSSDIMERIDDGASRMNKADAAAYEQFYKDTNPPQDFVASIENAAVEGSKFMKVVQGVRVPENAPLHPIHAKQASKHRQPRGSGAGNSKAPE